MEEYKCKSMSGGREGESDKCHEERIKRVYPLLMGNDKLSVFETFFYLSMCQSRHEHREKENGQLRLK